MAFNMTAPHQRLDRMRKSFDSPPRMGKLCRVGPFPGVKLSIGRRNGPRRNPQNGVEGIHRVEATVETKYELVEISLQMMRLDPAVMGAIDPRLQIGEHKVDHR